MIEKELQIFPTSLFDFSVLSPEDAEKELVIQVTMHLFLIMGTQLLLTSVVLLIVIINSTLTIRAMEFYNNDSGKSLPPTPPPNKNKI